MYIYIYLWQTFNSLFSSHIYICIDDRLRGNRGRRNWGSLRLSDGRTMAWVISTKETKKNVATRDIRQCIGNMVLSKSICIYIYR